jgi:hypothetical protein
MRTGHEVERIAIGRGFGGDVGPDYRIAAAAVVDNNRLTQLGRKPLGKRPCQRIGTAPDGKGSTSRTVRAG